MSVSTESLELVVNNEKKEKNDYLSDLINEESEIVSVVDHRNIITIYNHCSNTVKKAFDDDITNDISSWAFSDWIKIILPIVKAIEKYNTSSRKGKYKKTVAILVTKCIIAYDIDTEESNKILMLNAVDDYLKPSIDIIVYMINNMDIQKSGCLSCFK